MIIEGTALHGLIFATGTLFGGITERIILSSKISRLSKSVDKYKDMSDVLSNQIAVMKLKAEEPEVKIPEKPPYKDYASKNQNGFYNPVPTYDSTPAWLKEFTDAVEEDQKKTTWHTVTEIDFSSFMDDQEYDQRNIIYYAGDGVWADGDTGEAINPNELITIGEVNKFRKEYKDLGGYKLVKYFRDIDAKMDYQVISTGESWHDEY